MMMIDPESTARRRDLMRRAAARLVIAAAASTTGLSTSAQATPLQGANKHSGLESPGELYQQYCSVCHGERGDGQSRARHSLVPPPLDFTAASSAERLTRERMVAIVKFGVPGTAMVGWRTRLDDGQIGKIVDHILTTFASGGERGRDTARSAPEGRPAMTGEPPPERNHDAPRVSRGAGPAEAAGSHASVDGPPPVGDPNRGGPLYMANCIACHGALGDGQGPRAYFIRPKPRNFLSAGSRLALRRSVLVEAIANGRNGTEMPAWRTVLDEQQIGDIAEFVYRAYITQDGHER